MKIFALTRWKKIIINFKETENKQKEAGDGQFFLKKLDNFVLLASSDFFKKSERFQTSLATSYIQS